MSRSKKKLTHRLAAIDASYAVNKDGWFNIPWAEPLQLKCNVSSAGFDEAIVVHMADDTWAIVGRDTILFTGSGMIPAEKLKPGIVLPVIRYQQEPRPQIIRAEQVQFLIQKPQRGRVDKRYIYSRGSDSRFYPNTQLHPDVTTYVEIIAVEESEEELVRVMSPIGYILGPSGVICLT